MNALDRLRELMRPHDDPRFPAVMFNVRELSEFPDFGPQLAALRQVQASARAWRLASVREALGVPAVLKAVGLIANTLGVMSLSAYRNGAKLGPSDTPVVVRRPDPFRIPRDFFSSLGWNMATRGEGWLWVAARDFDGQALSVLSVPPREVTVEEDPNDLRYPRITWRGRKMPNADMRQITLFREEGGLRGIGPLQLCGAAVSVAVEAQSWAATFFAGGGVPSVTLESDVDLSEDEADALAAKWAGKPSNLPRVLTPSLHAKPFEISPEAAQLTQSREFQTGEVARMFSMPGTLLDAAISGQSLTYQNVGQEFDSFLRTCLVPNYMEPIEQTFSDLLTRSTIAKFNQNELLRADIKTRFDVYNIGVPLGVIQVPEARAAEGLEPGDVETQPIPNSPPQAIPTALGFQQRIAPGGEVRCSGKRTRRVAGGVTAVVECGRLLRTDGRPFVGQCRRCGTIYEAA